MSTHNMSQSADAVPMTEAELTALFQMNASEAAGRSLAALRLDRWASRPEIVQVGFQSLMMRGLVELNGDQFTAAGVAGTISQIASSADLFETVTVLGSNARAVLVSILAPGAGLLVTVHQFGAHEVAPIRSDQAPFFASRAIVDQLLRNPDCSFPVRINASRGDRAEPEHGLHATGLNCDQVDMDGKTATWEEYWALASRGSRRGWGG